MPCMVQCVLQCVLQWECVLQCVGRAAGCVAVCVAVCVVVCVAVCAEGWGAASVAVLSIIFFWPIAAPFLRMRRTAPQHTRLRLLQLRPR